MGLQFGDWGLGFGVSHNWGACRGCMVFFAIARTSQRSLAGLIATRMISKNLSFPGTLHTKKKVSGYRAAAFQKGIDFLMLSACSGRVQSIAGNATLKTQP